MYIVLFTVLHRCSNCVVKNGPHVSSLCGCHRGDALVTHIEIVHHHIMSGTGIGHVISDRQRHVDF
jgi:hypothetical protein